MKLLVLMAGPNKLETNDSYPFFLTEVNGKILLETVIESYLPARFSESIFCIKKDDIEIYNLDSIIRSIVPNAKIVGVGKTKGSVCTALLAGEYISGDDELLVVSSDDFISSGVEKIINTYRNNEADLGVVYFNSVHPRYSFIRRDSNGSICEFTEKKPVSREALVSFWYFRHGSDFIENAENVIRKGCTVNGAFYMSQSLNEMLLRQKKIVAVKVESNIFHSFKSERQLASLITKLSAEREK